MSNFQGIIQAVSGKEVKALASERSTYHTKQAKSLSDVFKKLVEVQNNLNQGFASDAPNSTPSSNNSAISGLVGMAISQTENQISYHNSRSKAAKFTAEHVSDGDNFQVTQYDLVQMGIIDPPNPRAGSFTSSQWAALQQIIGAASSQQGNNA